jgi:carbamoyltransferase
VVSPFACRNHFTRWTFDFSSGLCRRTLHLYAFLKSADMTYILGISAYYHDSAACLLRDGVVVAAAQEERFSRKKHDHRFPRAAIQYCCSEASVDLQEIDFFVFYEKPFLKFERILETYLAFAPKGFRQFLMSLPTWVKEKLFQKKLITDELIKLGVTKLNLSERILFSEHHLSHAASAFYPSPFENALVVTLDGVGEWATTSAMIGAGKQLSPLQEIRFPHSLGLLYSAFTYYTGFKVNSGEYKVMGLAPYGRPRYADLIKKHLVKMHPDGSFSLDMSYFDFATGLKMTSKKFDQLFGGAPRNPETTLTQREMDLAASIQAVTEEAVLNLVTVLQKKTGAKNLCLAGGVALNCVANGILRRKSIFENIWIQPAAGDAGGALGAALVGWHTYLGREREIPIDRDSMQGSFLGPRFSETEIERCLVKTGAVFHRYETQAMLQKTAAALAAGKAVGWMQGRMEFGPRALGGRSILADPRSAEMQKQLNLKVKFRESFRHLYEFFEVDNDSPYMLFVDFVRDSRRKTVAAECEKEGLDKLKIPRSDIPAVTHVDYSARIQTVHQDTNPRYYELLKEFHRITGCPILVNTSFNVRGEPIVCGPMDAWRCFMGTDLDVLVIENFVLFKNEQNAVALDYKSAYELD